MTIDYNPGLPAVLGVQFPYLRRMLRPLDVEGGGRAVTFRPASDTTVDRVDVLLEDLPAQARWLAEVYKTADLASVAPVVYDLPPATFYNFGNRISDETGGIAGGVVPITTYNDEKYQYFHPVDHGLYRFNLAALPSTARILRVELLLGGWSEGVGYVALSPSLGQSVQLGKYLPPVALPASSVPPPLLTLPLGELNPWTHVPWTKSSLESQMGSLGTNYLTISTDKVLGQPSNAVIRLDYLQLRVTAIAADKRLLSATYRDTRPQPAPAGSVWAGFAFPAAGAVLTGGVDHTLLVRSEPANPWYAWGGSWVTQGSPLALPPSLTFSTPDFHERTGLVSDAGYSEALHPSYVFGNDGAYVRYLSQPYAVPAPLAVHEDLIQPQTFPIPYTEEYGLLRAYVRWDQDPTAALRLRFSDWAPGVEASLTVEEAKRSPVLAGGWREVWLALPVAPSTSQSATLLSSTSTARPWLVLGLTTPTVYDGTTWASTTGAGITDTGGDLGIALHTRPVPPTGLVAVPDEVPTLHPVGCEPPVTPGPFIEGAYLNLPPAGEDTGSASVMLPDEALAGLSDEIDLRVDAALDQWGGIDQHLVTQWPSDDAGTARAFRLSVDESGHLELGWGAATAGAARSADPLNVGPGERLWVRGTVSPRQPPAQEGDNLLVLPDSADFEGGVGGWTATGGTLASASPGASGEAALTLTKGAAASALAALSPGDAAVVPGATYTAMVSIQSPVSRAYRLSLYWLASGTLLSEETSVTTEVPAGTWTRLSVQGAAPPGATHAAIGVDVPGSLEPLVGMAQTLDPGPVPPEFVLLARIEAGGVPGSGTVISNQGFNWDGTATYRFGSWFETLEMLVSTDGTALMGGSLTPDLDGWLAVAVDIDQGTQAYSSEDGLVWQPIGTPRPLALPTLFDSPNPVTIGDLYNGAGWAWTGRIHSVEMRSGLDPTGAERYLNPAVGTVSTPDPGPVPDQHTFIVKARGPVAAARLAAQMDPVGEWSLNRDAAGVWNLLTFPSATATPTYASGAPVTGADETFALSFDRNDGTERVLTLYRPDGAGGWSQIARTTGSPIAQTDIAANVRIGAGWVGDTAIWGGRIYSVELRSGLDPAGGSVLWRFDASEAPPDGSSWTDPRGRVWTLTSPAAISGRTLWRFDSADYPAVVGAPVVTALPAAPEWTDPRGRTWTLFNSGITADVPAGEVIRLDQAGIHQGEVSEWSPVPDRSINARLYTSADGSSWTRLALASGATVPSGVSAPAMGASTLPVRIGADTAVAPALQADRPTAVGRFYNVEIRTAIGGPLRVGGDFEDASPGATSVEGVEGDLPAYLNPTAGTVTTPDIDPIPPNQHTFVLRLRHTASAQAWHQLASQFDAGLSSWSLRRNLNGQVNLLTTSDGTNVTSNLTSNAPPLVPDADVWLAVSVLSTGDPATMATWTSPDGVTWTQHTVALLGTFGMFDSALPIRIGAYYGTGEPFVGHIYSVELRNGQHPAAGDVWWRFDASEYPGSGLSFTDPRGRVWTLSAAGAIVPPSSGDWTISGSAAIVPAAVLPEPVPSSGCSASGMPVIQLSWDQAGTEDFQAFHLERSSGGGAWERIAELERQGGACEGLVLPPAGEDPAYASAPWRPEFHPFTGSSLDVQAEMRMADWSQDGRILEAPVLLWLDGDAPAVRWRDGTGVYHDVVGTAPLPYLPDEHGWVRAKVEHDGERHLALGAGTATGALVAPAATNYQVQARARAADWTPGAAGSLARWEDPAGPDPLSLNPTATGWAVGWTVAGTERSQAFTMPSLVDGSEYDLRATLARTGEVSQGLRCDGGGAYANLAWSGTGSIIATAEITPDDWTLSAHNQTLVGTFSTTTESGWVFTLLANGRLYMAVVGAGYLLAHTSTAAVPFANGTKGWVRVTTNSANDTTFHTSTNGTTWTQLGSTVAGAGSMNIPNPNTATRLGYRTDMPADDFIGVFHSAVVYMGTGEDGNPNFANGSGSASSIVDSHGEVWTRSGVTSWSMKANWRVQASWSLNGTTWTTALTLDTLLATTAALPTGQVRPVLGVWPGGSLAVERGSFVADTRTYAPDFTTGERGSTGITTGSMDWTFSGGAAITADTVVTFYTSLNGSAWVALGAAVRVPNVWGAQPLTAALRVGSADPGQSLVDGCLALVRLYDGARLLIDADLTAQAESTDVTFTDSAGNVWAVRGVITNDRPPPRFTDYEAPTCGLVEYRLRTVRPDGAMSPWIHSAPVPAWSGSRGAMYLSSNEAPEAGLVYMDLHGAPERDFAFPEAGDLVTRALYGRDNQVAFRPVERRGTTFSRELMVERLHRCCPPDCPSGPDAMDPLRDLAHADLPYVCVRDAEGNRWNMALAVPSGTWRLSPQSVVIARVDFTEVGSASAVATKQG